jgi:hypothetical protein
LAALAERVTLQAAVALPYAGRNLDAATAAALSETVTAAHRAVLLAAFPELVRQAWLDALASLSASAQVSRQLAGCASRLLYEAAQISPDEVAARIGLALSLGTPVAEAAAYFEGFFAGASQRLIHDAALCAAVDGWMQSLDEDDFVAALPLFRRVFSELARSERQMLMQAALSGPRSAPQTVDADHPAWEAHLATLTRILTGGGYP